MSQIIRALLFVALFFVNLAVYGQKQNFTIDTTAVSGHITNLILNRPDFFYSKIGVEINASNPDFSADMRLSTRVKKDSLVFANANYMGIQAATVHITNSKGVLLNRFSKCYSEGNSELLSDLIGVELELRDLEEFLLGLPVYFPKLNKTDLSFKNDSVGNNQVTFSGNMRMSSDTPKWVDIVYTFDDSLTYMKQMNIQIPSDSISVKWKCEEYQDVSSFRVPSLVTISIQRGVALIDVQLKYNAVEINVPEKIEFEIPENYDKCN
jgi:hypothetical protein